MIRSLRPLPFAIALMGVLACVKLVGLVHAIGIASPAQASTTAAAEKPATDHARSEAKPRRPEPAPPAPPPPAEPPVSEAERSVLQELRGRRTQLDARAKEMDAREALLTAAERRLNERVEQLSALQSKLEQLENGRREREEANWRGLVKTYEAMRPRDAAAILSDIEGPVLLQVLDRMKEAKAAAVLAAMLPDRARAATAQLAQWRTRSSAAPTGEQPEGAKP